MPVDDAPLPLDALTPESRAILSLLLVQGRSYYEIAELLKIDPERVRQRAHAAVEALAAGELEQPGPDDRAQIADYLVGEQSVSGRARTRALLAESPGDRAWAQSIAEALESLAKDPLPAIPDPDGVAPAPGPTSPAEPVAAVTAPPAPRPAEATRDEPDRGGRPSRRTLVLAGVVVVAVIAVGVAIALALADDGSVKRVTVTTGATKPGKGKRQPVARTIRKLVLTPTDPNGKAFGAAAIVRQKRGLLLLLLQGRGLPPNRHDSYGVWLYNTPTDSRLLGFVSPAVGRAGTFSSGTSLPDDAVRFRELIITLETSSKPTAPGKPMLHSLLSLS